MVGFGVLMVMMTAIRFRVIMAEGMYENYQGRLLKIERADQPSTYWARILLMLSAGAAGVMMITQGTAVSHF
jgi:hypothetical protein